jgi:hypothetical protein
VSQVRKFKVKSRLSRFIFAPGGIAVHEALKRADNAIETMRPVCIAEADKVLATIDAQFGPGSPDRDSRNLNDLYTLSSQVIDVAICLQGSGIEFAARRLCELVDLSQTLEVRDWVAIDVHIDAMKVLRSVGASMTEQQRNHVLDGLAKVTRKRVGDPNALVAPASNGA